ncbi:MAG: helix-turn-helix transcriptional regulator [Thermoguttaceae bacterium]|nr:helix-turn-helix transcriptional regulator [Thermoguttaceae bacterium]
MIKGGVLIAAIVGLDTRSTMDIDTTLRGLPFVDEKISQTVGKSINQMSLEIGFTKGYLSRIISGERNPNDRLVSLLCTKYNVSETWLRTGEGEMFSTPESDIDVAMRVIADRVKRLAPDLQQEVYGLCRRILDQSAEPSSAKPKKTKNPASKTPKNK